MSRLQPSRTFIFGSLVAIFIGVSSFLAFNPLQPTPVRADEPVPTTLYLPWVSRPVPASSTSTYALAAPYTLFGFGDTAEQARQGVEYQLWGPEINLGTYRTKQRPPIPLSPKYLLMRSRAYARITFGIQSGDTGMLYLERSRVSGPSPSPDDVRIAVYRCPTQRPTDDPAHWHDEVLKLGEVTSPASPVRQLIEVPLDLTGVSVLPGEELCLEARGAENLTQELELGYHVDASRLEITRPAR